MFNLPNTKMLKLDELSLEERMFVLGSTVKPLPVEPEPINREYYNLGLEVFRIYNYFSCNKLKLVRHYVNAFKEMISLTNSGEIGDISVYFPSHLQEVRQTYESIVVAEEKEAEKNYQRLNQIVDQIKQAHSKLTPYCSIILQIVSAVYSGMKPLFEEGHKAMKGLKA